jgi:hypothetical protein
MQLVSSTPSRRWGVKALKVLQKALDSLKESVGDVEAALDKQLAIGAGSYETGVAREKFRKHHNATEDLEDLIFQIEAQMTQDVVLSPS